MLSVYIGQQPIAYNKYGQYLRMASDKIPPIDGKYVDFAVRFRRALAWKGYLSYHPTTGKRTGSYRKAADHLGISGQYLGELYRGHKYPSGAGGESLAKDLGVSHNWLMSGVGPMVADHVVSVEKLSEEHRQMIRSLIESLEIKSGDDK